MGIIDLLKKAFMEGYATSSITIGTVLICIGCTMLIAVYIYFIYKIVNRNDPQSEIVKQDKFGSNLLRHLVFGLEFVPKDNMWIGLGYNYKTRTDMATYKRSLLSGFSIGAGLKVKAFGFNLAFAQPHSGATTFMFNLTTSIGELMH